MDPHRRETQPAGFDEVARQRQKHKAASLDRLVSGFPAITVGELADQSTAAANDGGADAVAELLESGGHTPDTIERVLGCLGLQAGATPESDGTVYDFSDSPALRRLRTVAQLETLLVED